ncbi:hypothetical protein Tco_0542808, partial [Tanacetum coccineum]
GDGDEVVVGDNEVTVADDGDNDGDDAGGR